MRKEFDRQKESFSVFSASLVAGDTAILLDDIRVEQLALLLGKGVAVRTPEAEGLDQVLRQDVQGVEDLVRLAAVVDRRVLLQAASVARKSQSVSSKKPKEALEAKVHRLVVEQGFGVVVACRKVHCRPSDYYIYRGKLKNRHYGR